MAQFVYVISHTVAHETENNPAPLKRPRETGSATYVVRGSDSVGDVVEQIRKLSSDTSGQRVRILRICGHGRPGLTVLGDKALLSDKSVGAFQKIKGRFEPDGVIELHSCFVAGDKWSQDKKDQGPNKAKSVGTTQWIQTMANHTGVPVFASFHKQIAEPDWVFEESLRKYAPKGPKVEPPQEPYSPKHPMVGLWQVTIGDWCGFFTFDRNRTCTWKTMGASAVGDSGTWQTLGNRVEWKFKNDRKNNGNRQRVFRVPTPIQPDMNGVITGEDTGVFGMTKM